MANTEIFLRNIFGTTRPNIRPLVLALNITNDLLFEQHISMSDIKATKHIYPDVARLLHKKPETVYKSVIRLAHRCWDALVEQDLVLDVLTKREREIITLMFENSLTAAEIARRWGCSMQSVNQGKIVALKKLRKTFSTPISTKTLHNIERAKR